MTTLIAWARRHIAAAGAALLVMFGLYAKGRVDAKTKAVARDAAAYRETRRGVDDADVESFDSDPDAARRLMHERNANQRLRDLRRHAGIARRSCGSLGGFAG